MAGRKASLFSQHQPGGVFVIDDIEQHPGDIWFVDSGSGTDGAGYGQSPNSPTATIDYAIGLATASQGDVIYVLPGHNEAITAATSCVVDKIGLSIIGLGRGMNRPILDFDNTAGTIELDAASCRLSNLVFRCSVSNATVCINVDANDCEIDNCYFTFEATGDDWVAMIDVNAFDRCHIHDNLFESETGSAQSARAINLVDAEDVVIERNIFRGTWTAAVIHNQTTLCPRLLILDNVIYNADTSVYNGIDFGSLSSTGIVAHNVITTMYNQAGAIGKLIRTGDMTWHNNSFANEVSEGATGQLHAAAVPATTST